MPLFREKKSCPYCNARNKEPKAGESARCPSCNAPGPWAPQSEHDAYRKQIAEQAAGAEMRRYEQLRAALSLAATDAPGFVSQKTEEIYLNEPARLAEWKKGRGHYEGNAGIRGVSVKVPGTKSVRAYYGGLSPRQYVPGEEGWAITDTGHAVVTNKRIVFRGTNKNVEWAFAKLVGLDIDESSHAMVLQVSNRQRSHVLNVDDLGVFAPTVEAALARFQDRPLPALDPPPSLPTSASPTPARPDV